MRALQIEYIKLFRPATYILLAIFVILSLGTGLVTFLNVPSSEPISYLGLKALDTGQMSFIDMLFCIFVILNIGREYSENTLRKSIIDGYTRNEFFTGKLLFLCISAILTLIIQKGIFLGCALAGSHFKDALNYLIAWVLIASFLKIFFYGIFGFFIVFLTRSVALSIVIYFVWGIAESILKGILLFKFPGHDWNNYLPVSSMDKVLNGAELLAVPFILVPVAYQMIMLIIAYWLLLWRDIK